MPGYKVCCGGIHDLGATFRESQGLVAAPGAPDQAQNDRFINFKDTDHAMVRERWPSNHHVARIALGRCGTSRAAALRTTMRTMPRPRIAQKRYGLHTGEDHRPDAANRERGFGRSGATGHRRRGDRAPAWAGLRLSRASGYFGRGHDAAAGVANLLLGRHAGNIDIVVNAAAGISVPS